MILNAFNGRLEIMKIAHFVGTLKKDDGVGRVIFKITEGAYKKGWENIIVTGFAEDPREFLSQIIEIPSVRFPLYKDYRLPVAGKNKFQNILDQFKPDIIHIHSPDLIAWSAFSYAKRRNIPVIATHHTDFVKYLPFYHLSFLAPLAWFLLRKLYNRLKLVTTPSNVMADVLIKHGIKRVVAIPWGIDINAFNPKFKSKEWRIKIAGNETRPILVFVSRLTWEKDLETLIKTYELLKKNGIDFVLAVVGEGPEKEKLQKMMPEAKFLGYLKGVELSTAYASPDIFLFPSTTETFGNVTIEAMASGLAPVVADAGGSKAIVQHQKTGLLAKPKDARDFYEKVVFLLNNPKIRQTIQKNALDYARQFTWEKILEKIFEIYLTLRL